MTIPKRILDSIKDAMRAKDKVRLSTLRLMSAAIKEKDIATRPHRNDDDISDNDIAALLTKMVKEREESLKIYQESGHTELAGQASLEIGVIREFMPKPLRGDKTQAAEQSTNEETGETKLPIKLEQIPFDAGYPLRAPNESLERIAYSYRRTFEHFNTYKYIESYENALSNGRKPDSDIYVLDYALSQLNAQLVALHGLGFPIEKIADRALERIEFERRRNELVSKPTGYLLLGTQRYRSPLSAIAVLMLPTEALEEFVWPALFNRTPDKERVHVIDVLLSAFRPEYKPAKKYRRDKFAQVWADPLHKALGKPDSETKEAALAALMAGWFDTNRQFFPSNWKPWSEEKYFYMGEDGDNRCARPILDFAYEIALAVCAYDLDDTGFRHHPYYPADLVDYYRANVRNTRDAWRKPSAGPNMVLEPYETKRINLARKKAKGFRRWLDIASNGNADAASDVSGQFPRIRKIKNFWEFMAALGNSGIALVVDRKDDETCESELKRLIRDRSIDAEYIIPRTEYAAGLGRTNELIEHCAQWLSGQGYTLMDIQAEDSRFVVLVGKEWDAEFRALSTALGVTFYSETQGG